MLNSAIQQRRAGFSVIWLKKKSKAPVEEKWTSKSTMTVAELRSSYIQGYNCGVRLGEPSEIDGFYLHVVDIDVRVPEMAEKARRTLESLFKVPFSHFQAVISGSGGASRHLYFLTDKPFRSKKLWHSDEKITSKDGKEHWAAEIELFGTGKQVVLPPSIHPDTGKEYMWQDGEFSPEDLLEIDSEVIQEITGEGELIEDENEGPLGLSEVEIEEYIADLNFQEYCVDRAGWVRLGMALHHEFDGDIKGMKIWDTYSKKAGPEKYDRAVLKQQWRSFRGADRPVTFATIIKAANGNAHQIIWDSIVDEFEDDDSNEISADDFLDDDDDDVASPSKKAPEPKSRQPRPHSGLDDIPKHLLTIPGVLGLAVKHYNETSIQYQHQFAVQTALALGSVIMGRRWRLELTGKGTYASLYFMNLGATGSGKEFTRTYITSALEEAKLGFLVGPDKYASEPGLFSALFEKPRHISIVDEIGMQRQAQKKATDANAEAVTNSDSRVKNSLTKRTHPSQ